MTDKSDPRALVERLTGFTPGPWTLEVEQDEWPDHAIIGGNGDPVLWWDFDFGFRVSNADAAIIAAAPDLHATLTAALDELDLMKTAGIIEVAVRNPSVSEYMKHWEDRAEKAEAQIAEARAEAIREAMVICNQSYGDGVGEVHRRLAALIDAPAPAPSQPSVQEAAMVDPVEIERMGKRWHGEDHRVVCVRWEPYKKDGQRQMKSLGRWQEQVSSGDYWRWTNCGRPSALRALAGEPAR